MNVNGTPGFFPLLKIRPNFSGYYMTANGDIYSTKQYKSPRKMIGGGTTRGGRTYTFSVSNSRLPVTERGDTLFALAKRHTDWAADTSLTTPAESTNIARMPNFASPVSNIGTAERHHAASTSIGIAKKGYIIGQVQGEAIVFGSKPVVHTSLQSVKSEVERLAARSPGTQIIYVKIEGAAVANGIAWQ
jgi:hypothetical protein